jgi:hypothetical protein
MVADYQSRRGIEHHQRLQHVIERSVEKQILGAQLRC